MSYQRIDFYRRVDIAHIVAVPLPPAYEGPGDIVASAAAWWGLRAYSDATIGDAAVRLRRSSDNAEQNFATIADGGLDLAAISTFKGAANLFVVNLFDQTGNARHFEQTTAASQPALILSGIGSLPIVRFSTGSEFMYTGVDFGAQPFTHSFVCKRTSGLSLIGTTGAQVYTGYKTNEIFMAAGAGEIGVTVTGGIYHAVQAVYSGVSSDLNVNGSANSVSPGTNAHVTAFQFNTNFDLVADVAELGVWSVAFSSGQSSSMSSNQRTYWGF
jgi:hypothetical protein